jgi:alanine dehydrogenase
MIENNRRGEYLELVSKSCLRVWKKACLENAEENSLGIRVTLLVREKDLAGNLTMKDVLDAVEDGFRQHGLGLAQTVPRREVRIRDKELPHADARMTYVSQGLAFLEQSHVVEIQHGLNFPGRRTPPRRTINYLIDTNNGDVIAIVNSATLLRMRTGAAGAVGVKYLARKNSTVAGIVGAGVQGRVALRFLLQVRPIKTVYAYTLFPSETQEFCKEMSAELGVKVLPSDNVETVVRNADVVVTTTPSMSPIVKADWLLPGVHVNVIGADDPPKIELEGAALKKADKLVIAAEDCFLAGQMRIPITEGTISEKKVYGTIGEIIAGIKQGRDRDDEITIFHSPGVTIQDAAAVHKAYLKAKELGLGVEIPDPFVLD